MKKFATLVTACLLLSCTNLFAQNIQEILLNAATNGDTIEAPGAGTYIFDDGGENKKVDEQLLKFAKENKGAVLTIDFNLINHCLSFNKFIYDLLLILIDLII